MCKMVLEEQPERSKKDYVALNSIFILGIPKFPENRGDKGNKYERLK